MPRQTGKTKALIEELKVNEKALYIAASSNQAGLIRAIASRLGDSWADRILSVQEYLALVNRGLVAEDAELLIDELPAVLDAILERTVMLATITEDGREYDEENLYSFAL